MDEQPKHEVEDDSDDFARSLISLVDLVQGGATSDEALGISASYGNHDLRQYLEPGVNGRPQVRAFGPELATPYQNSRDFWIAQRRAIAHHFATYPDPENRKE